MKKCKHDQCKQDATENGFCHRCIQLSTEECNYCVPYKTYRIDGKDIDGVSYKHTLRMQFVLWILGENFTSFFNKHINSIEVKK